MAIPPRALLKYVAFIIGSRTGKCKHKTKYSFGLCLLTGKRELSAAGVTIRPENRISSTSTAKSPSRAMEMLASRTA